MLQECNKFREHQARETFIVVLEQQLAERKAALQLIQGQIQDAVHALDRLQRIESE